MCKNRRAFTFVLNQAAFLTLLVYFIVTSYNAGRTQSFISLDKNSGVCYGDDSSTSCCQVAQTITGTFLADTSGTWDTQKGFSYVDSNYAITVAGLEYTNAQWTQVMVDITTQLSKIGEKGKGRDLAW